MQDSYKYLFVQTFTCVINQRLLYKHMNILQKQISKYLVKSKYFLLYTEMGAKCCKCEDNARAPTKPEEHQMASLESRTFSSITAEELTDSEPETAPRPPSQRPLPPLTQVRDLITNIISYSYYVSIYTYNYGRCVSTIKQTEFFRIYWRT